MQERQSNMLYILLLFSAVTHTLSITTIPYPPTMVRQPPQEQLFQVAHTQDEPYRAFMLECEANGNPEPEYRWMKNGEEFDPALHSRITQQPRSGTLIVNKPEDEDEGIYQCFAENVHGVAVSNSVFLRKSELNSFPDEDMKDIFVIEGESLSVDCTPPSGYPKPTVFWVTQSKTGTLHTVNDSRISVDPLGNLHFSNVTQEDAIEDYHYACGVTSLFRNEYKFGNQIVLRVEPSGTPKNYPPTKQYVSPTNTIALRGNTLELHCIYGGTPVPSVKWSKKGGSLQSPRASTINYGKTLRIRKVDFQDEGTYECLASNGIGSPDTHSMAVTVQAAPFWINVANNTNGAEEESASFECVAGGIPTPQVQWYLNGVPIDKADPNPRRKLDKTANVLTIENLEKTDTAVFQCNASNIHGYAFRDFYLNVLALAPSFTERPEPITMAVKSSMTTLRCRVFGAPNPKIKWLKNGQEIKGDRFQILDNGDLEITNVAVKDAGDYTCYAINKFGDTEAMGKLEVKEKTRIAQPPENFEVAAGKSATFRCKAEYDETLVLTIEWLFDGRPVDSDLNQRAVQAADNSLTITKTAESDSGVYTCVAKTELDQDEATATLIVQDVPNPPEIVGVTCDKLTAMVEWRPMGDRRAPILSYTIQYNTSFTPDTWDDAFVNIPAPDTRFKVSMTPWANYTFRILATNKIGPSLPSDHSEVCTTPEDVPYKNPDKVVGKGTEKDNLVITWTAMPMIEQNAPGFFYKVFWKREDIPQASWEIEEIHDWEQNKLIIPEQPTFKPYRIKVEAHNERGQAHTAATEIIGYSGEDVPLEAPRNFSRLYVQDARSAMFSWSPVSPESVRGHFRGYKIQTWTVDEGEERLREEIVKANVTQALVTIFRPFSRNLVRVLAYNDMYNGPASDVIEFTTPEGTPGAVANFDAIPLGSSALYLIWKRPLEPNGILTGYTIYYNEVNGTDLGETRKREPSITDPRETRTKLSGLKAKTKYRLTIHATTSKGEGDPYFIEVETSEQAERAPDEPDFVWSHLPDTDGKAGVRVTWVPAVEGHPGSHFYVQYRKKGDSQWESTPMEEDQDSILVTGLELGSLYEMKVVAVDGRFQKPSKVEEIETGGMAAVQAPESGENFATAAWFIGMMCAIALLLLLLIIICLIKRNRGGKYSVHEKEAAQGRDLDYPEDGGFNEYTKPPSNQPPAGGSRTSLNSSVKGPESETDSMVDYGEGEESKFTEDGSFIGQYGANKMKGDSTSPSALATFV